MELRHLEYFVAVAEELSFTRGARRLHVVQSAVSSAIQGLERDLGAALFERDRRRVALTAAGKAPLPPRRPRDPPGWPGRCSPARWTSPSSPLPAHRPPG